MGPEEVKSVFLMVFSASVGGGLPPQRAAKLPDCAFMLKTSSYQISPLSPRHKNLTVRVQRRKRGPRPHSLFDREAIHVHQAAIVAAKRLITTSLMLAKWWKRWQPELPSREEELIWSSLSSPFWGQKQLRLQKPATAGICSRRYGASVALRPFRVWDPALAPTGFGSRHLGLGPVGAAGAQTQR